MCLLSLYLAQGPLHVAFARGLSVTVDTQAGEAEHKLPGDSKVDNITQASADAISLSLLSTCSVLSV